MNRRKLLLALLLSGSLASVGCSKRKSEGGPAGLPQAGVASGGTYRVEQIAEGTLFRGVVRYEGRVDSPERLTVDHDKAGCATHEIFAEELLVSGGGGVRNAVVWLRGVASGKAWAESEIVLDQAGCVYVPHVAVVGVGRPIKFVNSDPVIHNVNTFPKNNPPLNVSLLPKGQGKPVTRSLKLEDEIKVTCDAHKWMGAWLIVRDSPYYAITGPDGSFAIEGVPAGTFTVVVWHETLKSIEKTVSFRSGTPQVEDFQLQAR
ncbi:MAG: hypothetical protein HYY18_22625 [Planctomycetes bacterium]|nr:hypothetical protein [Planctomycetota bacterium]